LLLIWASHEEAIVRTHVKNLDIQSMTVEGIANDLISNLSPQLLLSSLAPPKPYVLPKQQQSFFAMGIRCTLKL
jgi:hypothetical protein